MSKALINPANIIWARERAGLDVPTLSKRLNITEDKLRSWENNEDTPTLTQARKIADQTLVSFGLLFSNHIPEERLPIPDLRTLDSKEIKQPSAALLKMIRIVLERQDWYKEYRLENMVNENKFITNFNVESDVLDIVQDMRNKLALPEKRSGSWKDYERALRESIEKVGVLVMKERDLGGKYKALLVEEFRGFAVYDEIAPVIFINGTDAPTAQLFTMMHELAHIWIGKSGLSDVSTSNHRKEEVLCNEVAAEFLVPAEEFLKIWPFDEDWRLMIRSIANYFHVSRWVIVRRALTLQLISENEFFRAISGYKSDYENNSNGGNYYPTVLSKRSREFAKAVVSEALSGRVLLRDAGSLLNVKPLQIQKLATELGI